MNDLFLKKSLEEAKKAYAVDEVPIGAVIVKNNSIIAMAHNKKEHDNCVISHAEILAIKKASKKLNNWRLDDCDIYVSLDPCPMCASAIKQSRIKAVYSCLNNSDFNNLNIITEIFKSDSTNPSVKFYSNLQSEKAKKILSDFFKEKRNK